MYLSNINNMKILICTPLHGTKLELGYVLSIFRIMGNLPKGFQVDVNFRQGSLVNRCRNELLGFFLASSYDYVFFIDSDIVRFENAFFRVANAYKRVEQVIPMIILGGAYPIKHYNFDKTNNLKQPCDLRENLLNFNINPALEIRKIPPGSDYAEALAKEAMCNRGLLECSSSGGGFLMFSRKLVEMIIKKKPELQYKKHYNDTLLPNNLYNLFHSYIDPETKNYLSEDYGFCKLAESCGANVYINIVEKLGHVGTETFFGSYNDNLRNRRGVAGTNTQGLDLPKPAPTPAPMHPPATPASHLKVQSSLPPLRVPAAVPASTKSPAEKALTSDSNVGENAAANADGAEQAESKKKKRKKKKKKKK